NYAPAADMFRQYLNLSQTPGADQKRRTEVYNALPLPPHLRLPAAMQRPPVILEFEFPGETTQRPVQDCQCLLPKSSVSRLAGLAQVLLHRGLLLGIPFGLHARSAISMSLR